MPKNKENRTEQADSVGTAPEVSGKLLDNVDKTVRSSSTTIDKPRAKTAHKVAPKPVKEEAAQDPVAEDDPLADKDTDMAVTDIAAKEGNTLLALQDAIGDKATRIAGELAEQDRKKARRRHWAWLIFFVVFILIVLLALPLNAHTCHWPAGIRLRVTTDMVPSVCK